MFKKLFLGLLALSFVACNAQEVSVWENFKQAKKSGTEAILPDFSFAGYKHSEEAIPRVNHKVFDITSFGAIANDAISDKDAIKKAIAAATKNGSGIIFFPKGKFVINTGDDVLEPIKINSSNIVFRGVGDGENGSILFFDKDLPAKDPNKLWTVPHGIIVSAKGKNDFLTTITSDTQRETFSIQVADASKINKGDWLLVHVKNNSRDLIAYDIQPLECQPEWKSILDKGVVVNERHLVTAVQGNTITFKEPIHYDIQHKHNWSVSRFAHVSEVGFENMRFEGNWLKKFKHHKSAQHDGGWSILTISKAVNSWIKDCTFKNVNNAAKFSSSAASTAINITIEGNIGHASLSASGGSTGILLANLNDKAGMHHAAGVGGGSTTATVIYRSEHPAHTSFESHASQPRCTLFDNVKGGFFLGRAGGARQNLPNHGRYLVLWNFNETDEAEQNFEFWSTKTWFWKIVPPIIVGFHGSGTTFKTDEVQVLESLGTPVQPESLFEEQLKLRLGSLPKWLIPYSK